MAKKKGTSGPWKRMAVAKKGMNQVMKLVAGLEANVKYVFRVQATYVPAKIRKMSVRELSNELQVHGKGSYTPASQGDKNTLITR